MTNMSKQGENSHYERYSMLIQWSEEDEAYIVSIPELPGAMTHGSTYEEAARQGQDLIESVIDAKIAWGRPVPPPNLFVFPEEVDVREEEVSVRAS